MISGSVDTVGLPNNGNGRVEGIIQSGVPQGPNPEISSDMATVISDIMNHSGRVEEQYALGQQQLESGSGQSTSTGLVYIKANSHLKIQSLPILDNLVSESKLISSRVIKRSHMNRILVNSDFNSAGQVYLPRHRCLHLRT